MEAVKIRTSAQIAQRNDTFRICMIPAPTFALVLTEGVLANADTKEKVLTAVREFKFDPTDKGNNPYGENDFGKVTVDGEDYFFKFDYYAPNMKSGADPYTTTLVKHVLTIMEASEY